VADRDLKLVRDQCNRPADGDIGADPEIAFAEEIVKTNTVAQRKTDRT
jgi:hypothetical protein